MHAARNPKMYILGVLIASIAAVGIGLKTNFYLDTDSRLLWTPRDARVVAHSDWVNEESGFPPAPRYFLILVHGSEQNILGQEGVARVFEAVDTVRSVPGYEDVCSDAMYENHSGKTTCKIESVTSFWNDTTAAFESQVGNDEEAIKQLSAQDYPDGTPVSERAVLGYPVRAEDGLLESTTAYVTRIELPDESEDEVQALEDEAVARLLDLRKKWANEPGSLFRLELLAEYSSRQELQRAIIRDIPLVPGVFGESETNCNLSDASLATKTYSDTLFL